MLLEAKTTGPVGRFLRVILGVVLIVVSLPFYVSPGVPVKLLGISYLSTLRGIFASLGITIGFLAFYLLIYFVVIRQASDKLVSWSLSGQYPSHSCLHLSGW